jgi:16S rRNA processing protein RimM
VAVDSDNPDRFKEGSVVHARSSRPGVASLQGGARRRLTVESVRGAGVSPIVAFKEITVRKDAEALAGCALEVEGTALPPLDKDEFYPFDLVGLAVEDPRGTRLGLVSQVLDSPAHGVLEITLDAGGKTLVPFVSAAVPSVATEAGYLVVEPQFLDRGRE